MDLHASSPRCRALWAALLIWPSGVFGAGLDPGQMDLGGYCAVRPDRVTQAPNTLVGSTGVVTVPYDFVVKGPRVAAARNLGIGVVGRIPGVDRPVALTVRSSDPYLGGRTESWAIGTDADGTFWLGAEPPQDQALLPGIYRYVVLYKGTVALDRSIEVTAAQPNAPPPCGLPVS